MWKRNRWYNLQIKNILQTTIWKKIPEKRGLKTFIQLIPMTSQKEKTPIEYLNLNINVLYTVNRDRYEYL